jgi:hypothetical protein
MKLAAALVVLLAGPAFAETSLEEYDSRGRRPAQDIREAQCDLDVQMKGAVVTVEQRQRFTNASARSALAYLFDLPPGAAITSFSYRLDTSAFEQALPIVGEHETAEATGQRAVLGSDPAMLFARPEGSSSQYAIHVQPWDDGHSITLVTRYTALAKIVSGALRFELPPRAGIGAMTACRGTLSAVAGPGASVSRIVVNGASTTARPASFTLDNKPVTIDAQLAFAGKAPLVWTQSEVLSGGYTASVVTVATPPLRTQTPLHRRAMIVIDTSRSMELVGKQNVSRVLQSVTSALPANVEIEAILYDRTAIRLFDGWRPLSKESVSAIEKNLSMRGATNGSDLPGALRLARKAILDGKAASTLVVVITDGVIGDVASKDLIAALDAKISTVDVLGVLLNPARTTSPGEDAIRGPVSLYGGSIVEVPTVELDTALSFVDDWLRPATVELSLGNVDVPTTVVAGAGFVRTVLDKRAPSSFVLAGRGEAPIRVAPRSGPAASVTALVLANTADDDPDAMSKIRQKAAQRAPYVSENTSFSVLSFASKVSKNRTAMVKGGGPYERVVEIHDPADSLPISSGKAQPQPSSISKDTLERLFRDQLQPKAYACYQRALGLAPTLAGTVHFTLHLGRGEITQVQVAGIGNAQLDACLIDAAYVLSVPMPDFSVNADDQTIARYPLTFTVGKDRPVIVLGDADSESPIDIDAVQGGVPVRKGPIKVDAKTPLGTMRPSK